MQQSKNFSELAGPSSTTANRLTRSTSAQFRVNTEPIVSESQQNSKPGLFFTLVGDKGFSDEEDELDISSVSSGIGENEHHSGNEHGGTTVSEDDKKVAGQVVPE